MNIQGPGKIEYLDYTWNPVQGCKHNCPFCYVPRIKARFSPGKSRAEIMEPRYSRSAIFESSPKKPSRIGVCFTGDLFGEWVPGDWIGNVLIHIEMMQKHKFIVLTRNPARYAEFKLPSNLWAGVSVSDLEHYDLKQLNDRVDQFTAAVRPGRRVLSLEPLTTIFFDSSYSAPVLVTAWMGAMDWVIIGGLTGKGAQPTDHDELQYLVEFAQRKRGDGSRPLVFVKSNAVADPVDPLRVQEYPEGLRV